MKDWGTTPIVAMGLATLAAAVLLTGCEDSPSKQGVNNYFDENPYQSEPREDSAIEALRVAPVSVRMLNGQAAVFTAAGGQGPFTWSVAVPAVGTAVKQSYDRQAIYTHTGGTNDANSVIVSDGIGRVAVAGVN